jgi:hypothetical protein
MIQQVIVTVIFIASVAYLARLVYRSFQAKTACGTGCKCGIDFEKLESDLRKKSV